MNMKNKLITMFIVLTALGCSIAPGMHMETKKNGSESYVYIDSLNRNITVNNISEFNSKNELNESYRIGKGDQISITVWGLPDIFPIANISPDQNLRRVDSKGDIFFPYAGRVRAFNKTQEELREDLNILLSNFFTDPQIDVTIARFNSQKVYLLGEITQPKKINITDIPLSLSEALGEARGINTLTANGSEVFIIRQAMNNDGPMIFRADLGTPAGFIDAGGFLLKDNDIIYVNAKGTARWNRVISQFFPFSSFLNSIDNLTSG